MSICIYRAREREGDRRARGKVEAVPARIEAGWRKSLGKGLDDGGGQRDAQAAVWAEEGAAPHGARAGVRGQWGCGGAANGRAAPPEPLLLLKRAQTGSESAPACPDLPTGPAANKFAVPPLSSPTTPHHALSPVRARVSLSPMAPSLLARALPSTSRALARAPPRTLVCVRFNSSIAPEAPKLSDVAAKARVVKTLPDFSMANKVRAPSHTPLRTAAYP